MKSNVIAEKNKILNNYYDKIDKMIFNSQKIVKKNINYEMVQLYYNIGQSINELIDKYHFEASQNEIIKSFSIKLTNKFGKGYSVSNLKAMKKFYLTYRSTGHTVCDHQNISSALWNQLSWSHNRLIMNIENNQKRNFYLNECVKSNWSVRQLERQINSFYYERLVSTSDKYKKEVQNEINLLEKHDDINNFIKDPYVLEFLDIKDRMFLEKDLESNLLEHIQEFLLELGRGFSFISRQKRIEVDGDNFYIDLVFYNYTLKCFTLIDLKLGKLTH